ncbi:GerAB/ArcD/ProY family transporter [Geosporobacter ferrireducens]|uniref:Spore gernimation protein n=1 Tax=Geosporobacter ferrireducens TaxID=1424294 RepID=A0A1D8GL11_9FIRM|nr:endospore germination permease [Geosporobacter ferrireducens]AOT71588.1 spore gernimation protein [Geosporobacter ferrireducens]MTI55351.1 spore gernimation protein [Geosporobacter ferrireducens]
MYKRYKNGEITAIQSFIILISIMIGTGVLGLSKAVAEVSRQDAWISVLLNGIFIGFVMMIIIYTVSRFPKYNFFQYTSHLLGKLLGYLITFSFVIYAILVTATVIRFLSEMISTWLLQSSPLFVINLIIVATVVYMVKNGITVLARYNEVIIFMLIPFALLILVGLPEASFVNLRPVGGTGITTIIKGATPSFFSFAGYEVLLVYYPYISNKQQPIMRNSVVAVLFVTLFYTASVAAQIALYGPQEIKHVLYPSINYLTSVDFPVFERVEIFFTIFWVFTVLGTIGIQYLAGCILLQNVFSNKKTSFFAYILSPIVYVITLYPQSTRDVIDLGDTVGKANIFFGLIFPLIIFVLYFIRGRKPRYEKNN